MQPARPVIQPIRSPRGSRWGAGSSPSTDCATASGSPGADTPERAMRSPRTKCQGASAVLPREGSASSKGKAQNKITPSPPPRSFGPRVYDFGSPEHGMGAATNGRALSADPRMRFGPCATQAYPSSGAGNALRTVVHEEMQLAVRELATRMEASQRALLDAHATRVLEAVAQRPPLQLPLAAGEQTAGSSSPQPVRKQTSPRLERKELNDNGISAGDAQAECEGEEESGAARQRYARSSVGDDNMKSMLDITANVRAGLPRSPSKAPGARSGSKSTKSKKIDDTHESLDVLANANGYFGEHDDHGGRSSPIPTALLRMMIHIQRVYADIRLIQVPKGDRPIDQVVNSLMFDNLCSFMIALNAIFIILSTNYEVQNPGQSENWQNITEYAFAGWYICELLLKLWAHGRYFFVGSDCVWNWFDFALVTFTSVTVFIFSGINLSGVRAVRFLKISKIFRLFRFLEFLKDVKLMLFCMLQSLVAVFWCLAMIVFMLFLFSVIILQGVILALESNITTPEEAEKLQSVFSSVETTMVVLFQSTTGGLDWSDPYGVLGFTHQAWIQWLYLFYIAFFAIAVWNIVTCLFLEKAMDMSQPDKEEYTLQQRRAELRDVMALKELLSQVDIDHSNTISMSEFQRLFQVPEFRHFLEHRGVHIREAGTFFAMVAKSVGQSDIDIETLIACCLRIKGYATSIDLHTLRFEMKTQLLEQKRLFHDLRSALGLTAVAQGPTSRRSSKRSESKESICRQQIADEADGN